MPAPTNLTLTPSTVAENNNAFEGILSTIDPDAGDTFTYSLVEGTGDTDNSLFIIIDENKLTPQTDFDFETKNSYSVRVRTTDKGGLTFERQLTIGVTNVNEAPTDLSYNNTTDTTTIDESPTDGVIVIGNLISTDPDAGNTFTYSLITGDGDTDNDLFTIVDNQLIANTVFDFETKTSYSIRVQTTDQGGLSFERQLNINVNDINEAPTDLSYDNNTDTTAIDEGKPIGTVVGNLISADQDTGSTFTYSLITGDGDTDNDLFTIVDNQLIANIVFDFETKDSYSIRVQTTDQGGLTFEKQLNINVKDIDGPTDLSFDNTTDTTTIDEGQTDSVIGNLISTDPDTGSTFTYILVAGDGDTDNSSFSIVGNQLIANIVFNFETKDSYSIRVKTTDQDGLFYEKPLTIGVTNVNETPTDLTLSNSTVAENKAVGTVVGNFSSTDPDTAKTLNTFTYSLVSGTGATDNSLFTIVDNQLQTNSVFNFETKNSYSIRVQTRDQNGLFYEKPLTIGVTNVNEAPVITSAATATFAENGTGTVYTVTATDADAATTLTYSLSGADANLFNINNRAVTFKTAPNFEAPSDNGANNVYNINVIANDGTLTDTEAVAITVTNVNEAPTLNRPSSANSNTFVLQGDSKERLQVKLTGYKSKLNSELGVFTVDDPDGKIDGIAPGATGYTEKALQRGQVIFSLLGNPPAGFNQSSLSRLLEFNYNSNLRFYLVKDGSTDSVLNNTTPKNNVLFDIPSNVRTTTSGNGFSLAWEDGSGNPTGFEDLRVTINPTDTSIARGTSVQNKPQRELLDLRNITGPVKADFVVNREAAYNNFVGFYKVADENGGIDTDGNGTIDVRPGATGYAQAALKARVSDLALAVNNNGTANFNNKTLQGGSFFAPFIITNGGTPDNYDNINSRIYFTFGAANSDGVDHVRLLGDNTFGFEDLAGGGDNDFNDVIVKVNLTV
ncbi:cadherin domain-containing protein [Dolichospermum circinale]|uniref:cadherin domain-containing protein n=1 Tax=Dolichospermum circinale TaxID=109265 RepID=UPI00232CB3FB|nr:cadherin domain-containing protein [Dolichospermum circinale]MDB9452598.1 cadherin domain-containing protein [Dolichospermum circinale CS-547]